MVVALPHHTIQKSEKKYIDNQCLILLYIQPITTIHTLNQHCLSGNEFLEINYLRVILSFLKL
jgi:hypothetical protein